ncbi:MAG TPA: Gfo/Idh/MocA family oxidoreductase, partial [Polyangia bacterium]
MAAAPAPAAIGVGIIGAGNIARLHARALTEMARTSGVVLRAVLGSSMAKALALAAEFGAEATADPASFFS